MVLFQKVDKKQKEKKKSNKVFGIIFNGEEYCEKWANLLDFFWEFAVYLCCVELLITIYKTSYRELSSLHTALCLQGSLHWIFTNFYMLVNILFISFSFQLDYKLFFDSHYGVFHILTSSFEMK